MGPTTASAPALQCLLRTCTTGTDMDHQLLAPRQHAHQITKR
eukprot:CAMPEP_0204224944 /NCGR_PEP_ID=MMETSP0361-20130328/83830_1 /ASSEMBLY_ACC=CAM_ASM_000343 /TAXON_ID=268821 /ORGANISM="Scrippsiella Hangoei, Strain SHTV-5" /LENGTH=41 /DNA_ID= /DNA_START= /DNA_END= /DNA_ORIENTATION=